MAETLANAALSPGVALAVLLDRTPVGPEAFTLTLRRPEGFTFLAGQRVRIGSGELRREYTLAGAPSEPHLRLLVRRVSGGRMSQHLARLPIGSPLPLEGPCGYFTFQPSHLPAVFVATGTGVAPFRAMAGEGVEGFTLLHGVRTPDELYFRRFFEAHRCTYRPCISGSLPAPAVGRATPFPGRVTECLAARRDLPGAVDFYLCGRREMIRDVTRLADRHFSDARIFTEIFF